MDKPKMKIVHDAIQAAIDEVGKKHGFAMRKCRMTYDDTGFKVTAETYWRGENGEPDGEKKQWDLYAPFYYKFAEADFGRAFEHNGRMFRISGCAPRSRTRPIIGTDVQGKRFKFTVDQIRRAFAGAK